MNARLSKCGSCGRLLLLSYWYPLLRRPTCLVCQRGLTTTPDADPAPFADDRTPAGRLRAAETTMRLRALAAGRTYAGRTEVAYAADDRRERAARDDAPAGECASLTFGGQAPTLAGYARAVVA